MKELPIPKEVIDDPNASEMLRLWIGNNDVHASLLLGKFEENQDLDITEKEAWGQLLAKQIRHISNAMYEKYGFDKHETEQTLAYSLLHHLQIRVNNTINDESD
jgi:hypothetical protein